MVRRADYDRELFKQAHRKADAQLAKKQEFEYIVFREKVKKEFPKLVDPELGRYARVRLRKAFPHTFVKLYNIEKKKLGLPLSRDFAALAIDIVEMYNERVSMRQIAVELQVSYAHVQRQIRAYQKKRSEENG